MSISGIEQRKKRKTALRYFFAAAFCGLFSAVYEHYSHGVYANSMIYLFLYPLLGGTLIFLLLSLFRGARYPGGFSAQAYHCGIATLTVGSCLHGVLEIYGTSSDFIKFYSYAGYGLLSLGVLVYLLSLGFRKKEPLAE